MSALFPALLAVQVCLAASPPAAPVATASAAPAAKAPAAERSPYLEMGKDEAVRWRPFGPEAFREAESRGLPVLLDLGAMWCHSCREMSGRTYRHPGVAREIEDHYVPIRVDRDQFPGFDARMQAALARIRQVGGWPITAFLTETGRVVAAGTFYEPDGGVGQPPGLKQAAARFAADYQAQKKGYRNTGEQLAEALIQDAVGADLPGALPELVAGVAERIRGAADRDAGGFGDGAKFLSQWPAFAFALERGAEGDAVLADVAAATLDGIANGAVRDRFGGGFHRASRDRYFREPRWEKLLSVNAGMLDLFADSWRLTGNERHRKVAEETLDYLLATLSDRERGGFYAAQAGDREPGDDGSTYTWTLAELGRVVDKDALPVLLAYYGIDPAAAGDSAFAMSARVPIGKVAQALAIEEPLARTRLEAALAALRTARRARPEPAVDRTVYASSTGLAAAACLRAAVRLEREDARAQALRSLDRLLARGFDAKTGFARGLRDDDVFGEGILADQVFMARALIDAYEASGKAEYLGAARATADLALLRFGDGGNGTLLDLPAASPADQSMYVVPRKPVRDGLEPAENAVLVEVLTRLGRLMAEPALIERARAVAKSCAGSAKDYGIEAAALARAVAQLEAPARIVIVVGGKAGALADRVLAARESGARIPAVVRVETIAGLPPGLRTRAVEKALAGASPPAALVIAGGNVHGPAADAAQLVGWLGKQEERK